MNNQSSSAASDSASIDVPPAQSNFAEVTKARQDAHRDLVDLTARGAPVGEAPNAAVRAVAKVRRTETRAAIFIFVAAEGLSEGYTSIIDNSPVGPGQPSCGRAAYIGDKFIVDDVATDPYWAPFRELADEHRIRACWSFLLKGTEDRTLGTFALYHRVPCEPDATDYEEVRYFANIASLIIERHLKAESRKRAQEAIEANLRESNRHKDAFLATLAHELRNPMGAIKNALGIMHVAGNQAATRERALTPAERQLKHMEWLVEDLLVANRITRGALTLRRETMPLQPALDLAAETVMPLCVAKDQSLTITMPAEPISLHADPVRVTQMITNLLNNAHKFTGRGGRIFLNVEVQGEEVHVQVRDEGVGIAADKLAQIFEMFAQVNEGPDGANAGLGIGLTLVRSLAAMLGGSVDAASGGLGMGATFCLRLPVSDGSAHLARPSSEGA